MYTVDETYKNIEAEFKPRSKWDQGVKDTALALLDSLDMPETVLPDHFGPRRALLLNGADNWREYSYGGCALVYNVDIAARFFTPSEMRRYMMQAWRSVASLCLTCRRVPSARRSVLSAGTRGNTEGQVMCEKCPIDQRYPYYGFPVTPDSRKLRDEAERYREIAIRCFVAESDCADVKRADALWREMCRASDEARFLCSNARRLEMEEALQCRAIEYPNCPNRKRMR
jgi:hypothetical protein